MRPNKIKQMWRDGKCATLGWLSVAHGYTAEVMARQGFDALCVACLYVDTHMMTRTTSITVYHVCVCMG